MSIFDHPDTVPTAPSWRCPHCRTLQPETSRCWACSRAAVNCSTCHLYRASVATDLGYCASDRAHTPISGDEVCACWEAAPTSDVAPGLFADPALAPTPVPAVMPPPTASQPAFERRHVPPPEEVDLRGAWTEGPPPGGLVEAPQVAPGRRLMSELQRRSRRNHEG